jgi:septum site-determining protein MinD
MGKTLSFVSIKGGVGKTTLASSVAADLANTHGKKVLLVDANLSAPNAGLHMDVVNPEKTLHHVMSGKARPKDAIHSSHGVDVVPGSYVWNGGMNPLKLKDKIKGMSKKYDYTVLDSSPSLHDELLASVLASDHVFLVSTPDYPTMSATLRAAGIAKQRGKEIAGIVVNKIRDPKHELNLAEIEEVTGIPVVAKIPDDKANISALFARKPTTLHKPRCKFSRAVGKFSAAVANKPEKKGLLDGLLGKSKDAVNRQVMKEEMYRRVFR